MIPVEWSSSPMFSMVILPLVIFFLRIMDVSIGTIRIIFVSRGNKLIAPILGFFEVFIWVIAISNIIQDLDNWYAYFAYAGGFATGNYIGMLIEERLAMGISLVRIITKRELIGLREALFERGYGTTTVEAHGKLGEVNMIYTIVKRKDLEKTIALIKEFNPAAFYTIEDIRYVSQDNFPMRTKQTSLNRLYFFQGWRKGK